MFWKVLMKKISLIILLSMSVVMAQPEGFVNPLNYDHSEQQKAKVIQYIKEGNLHKYCDDEEACHPSVLQLAQSDNVTAFLELSKIQNKEYLNKLIEENCNSEFFKCSYEDLLKVYEENFWCDVGIWEMRNAQNIDFKNRQYPNPIVSDSHADLIH